MTVLLVPDDYDDLLSYYTKRGYRVIAIAGKSIEGLSWLKAQRLKRFANSHFFENALISDRILLGSRLSLDYGSLDL